LKNLSIIYIFESFFQKFQENTADYYFDSCFENYWNYFDFETETSIDITKKNIGLFGIFVVSTGRISIEKI
jgi:hypothetical protein